MLSDSAPNELSAAETSLIRADRDEFGGLDQFSCDSNEALKLNFCSLNNTFQAKPIYTHHLFDRYFTWECILVLLKNNPINMLSSTV